MSNLRQKPQNILQWLDAPPVAKRPVPPECRHRAAECMETALVTSLVPSAHSSMVETDVAIYPNPRWVGVPRIALREGRGSYDWHIIFVHSQSGPTCFLPSRALQLAEACHESQAQPLGQAFSEGYEAALAFSAGRKWHAF